MSIWLSTLKFFSLCYVLSFFTIKHCGGASLVLKRKKPSNGVFLSGPRTALVTSAPALCRLPERTLHPHLLQRGCCCQHPPETPQERSPRPSMAGAWTLLGIGRSREALPPPWGSGEGSSRRSSWAKSIVNSYHSKMTLQKLGAILHFQNHNHTITKNLLSFPFTSADLVKIKSDVSLQHWSRN